MGVRKTGIVQKMASAPSAKQEGQSGSAVLHEHQAYDPSPSAIADDADTDTKNDHSDDVGKDEFDVTYSPDQQGKWQGYVSAPKVWPHWTKSFVHYKPGQCVGFWFYNTDRPYDGCFGPNNLPEFNYPPPGPHGPNPAWRMQVVCTPKGECPTIRYRRTTG